MLACAVTANAELIVSGDRDLLGIKAFREVQIVNAAHAVRLVTGT